MLLHALVGTCAFGAGYLVWRHDAYDREPWWALLGTAILGALLMPACGVAEDRMIFLGTSTPSSFWIASNAAFFEGGARMLATGAVALLLPRVFNDPMDGVTYGSMAGIGMALYESSVYLGLGAPGGPEVARIYAHLVLGGICGFPFGMRRVGIRGVLPAFLLCGTASWALHAAIDAASLRAVARPEFLPAATAITCVAVLAATILYGNVTVRASEWSRERFAPFSPQLLFRWPF